MSDDQQSDHQQKKKTDEPAPISPAPISFGNTPNPEHPEQTPPTNNPSPISFGSTPKPSVPQPPVQPGTPYQVPGAPPVNPYQAPPPPQNYPPAVNPPGQYPVQPGQPTNFNSPPANYPPQVPGGYVPPSPPNPPQPPANQPGFQPPPVPNSPPAYSPPVPPSPTSPTPGAAPLTPSQEEVPAPQKAKPAKAETTKQKPTKAKKKKSTQEPPTQKTPKKQPVSAPPKKQKVKPTAKQQPKTKSEPKNKTELETHAYSSHIEKQTVVVGSEEPVIVDAALEVDAAPVSESIDIQQEAIHKAPAWLVSMVIHAVLAIVLALLTVQEEIKEQFFVNATYAEKLGDQLDDPVLTLSTEDLISDAQMGSLSELPSIEDTASINTLTNIEVVGPTAATKAATVSVGTDFKARGQGSQKSALIAAYGGNSTTEETVRNALEWLKRNQSRDGSWSLKGPYRDGSGVENKVAATAMALLAFQGAGHTDVEGSYTSSVSRGWKFLLDELDRDGNFMQSGFINQHRLYSQAQATMALCELYGMTQREDLRSPAQRAIEYAVRIQSPEGGWRYNPGEESDLSVTGWFVMALQSARISGLKVPQTTFENIEKFLKSVSREGGSKYIYKPSREADPTPTMTAEALLCRQYMGWKQDDPRLLKGIDYLLDHPVDWEAPEVYYWYYGTQVMHHAEGDAWNEWNRVMRQVIPENQVQGGPQQGSWNPQNDPNGVKAGRLFMTCMCTYMLEVYYRHLPIYSKTEVMQLK